MTRRFVLPLLLCLALLAGCAPTPKPPEVEPPEREGFIRMSQRKAASFVKRMDPADQNMDSWAELRQPLRASLKYVRSKPSDETAVDREGLRLTWKQMEATLAHLLTVLPVLEHDPQVLSRGFVWYELAPEPLMTGYYSPEVEAALKPSGEYEYPIYGKPDDLRTLKLGDFHPRWEGQRLAYRMEDGRPVPYYDREAIDLGGALKGRDLELAWAKHPWDIYHLQVQGSGFLRLPDGSRKPILYAGKNGRQFDSSTHKLLERGLIDRGQVHRDGIRDALDAMGEEAMREILAENPSYVFFHLAEKMPTGSFGAPVTPMVSLATDPELLPLGSVLPFTVDLPTGPDMPRRRVFSLGLAQDTGGVIKGRRLDYYIGSGELAGYRAFRIKNPARTYLLVSRTAEPPTITEER
ncbi:MltA domain-containing protein [Desulfohalovibrio reitneri]|uniref:MltA domain-containing protein n=1 Tax=Desulfohalovibrio reitneri TaxID=1307759 RepID=UPI000558FFAD|nr:MltA domain-containing protein [Desulfohalovibrio reitneri]